MRAGEPLFVMLFSVNPHGLYSLVNDSLKKISYNLGVVIPFENPKNIIITSKELTPSYNCIMVLPITIGKFFPALM